MKVIRGVRKVHTEYWNLLPQVSLMFMYQYKVIFFSWLCFTYSIEFIQEQTNDKDS